MTNTTSVLLAYGLGVLSGLGVWWASAITKRAKRDRQRAQQRAEAQRWGTVLSDALHTITPNRGAYRGPEADWYPNA